MSSDLCFSILILGLFIGILGFIVFGPYTVSVRGVISAQELTLHFVLASLGKCFKIEWRIEGVKSESRIAFLWIPISRFPFLKSRENATRGVSVSPSQKIPWKLFLKWLVQMKSMIRIRSLKIHCTVGTGNPLFTGLIYGVYSILFQKENRSLEIRIFPDFLHKTFSANGEMTLQFGLLRIILAYFQTLRIQTRRRHGH